MTGSGYCEEDTKELGLDAESLDPVILLQTRNSKLLIDNGDSVEASEIKRSCHSKSQPTPRTSRFRFLKKPCAHKSPCSSLFRESSCRETASSNALMAEKLRTDDVHSANLNRSSYDHSSFSSNNFARLPKERIRYGCRFRSQPESFSSKPSISTALEALLAGAAGDGRQTEEEELQEHEEPVTKASVRMKSRRAMPRFINSHHSRLPWKVRSPWHRKREERFERQETSEVTGGNSLDLDVDGYDTSAFVQKKVLILPQLTKHSSDPPKEAFVGSRMLKTAPHISSEYGAREKCIGVSNSAEASLNKLGSEPCSITNVIGIDSPQDPTPGGIAEESSKRNQSRHLIIQSQDSGEAIGVLQTAVSKVRSRWKVRMGERFHNIRMSTRQAVRSGSSCDNDNIISGRKGSYEIGGTCIHGKEMGIERWDGPSRTLSEQQKNERSRSGGVTPPEFSGIIFPTEKVDYISSMLGKKDSMVNIGDARFYEDCIILPMVDSHDPVLLVEPGFDNSDIR